MRDATALGLVVAALSIASTSAAQTIVEQARLLPGGASGDRFGASIDISGTTMVVGAPYDDVDGKVNQGSAYVFVLTDGVWQLQARLLASDGAAGDQFGQSVTVDGDVLVVGAPYDDNGSNTDLGAVYFFTRSGGIWTQDMIMLAGTAGSLFGFSVALDGDRLLAGAPMHDVGPNANQGVAYLFRRAHGVWGLEKTFDGGGAEERSGYSVALSGTVAAVSAPMATAAGHAEQGVVRLYTYTSGAWAGPVPLTSMAGVAGDRFGVSIDFGKDSLIVGAYQRSVSGRAQQGAGYVFTAGPSGWAEQATLTSLDGAAGDTFGMAVAIDGDTAFVGAPLHDPGGSNAQGSAYVFTRSGSNWTQQVRLNAIAGASGDDFGRSVALAGGTALSGAPLDNIGTATDQGTITVFNGGGASWSAGASLTGIAPDDSPWFGGAAAAEDDTVIVGADYEDVGANSTQGAAYVFVRAGGVWVLQARLVASDGAASDHFGATVAYSSNTAIVGVSPATHEGAAYIFIRSGSTWSEQAKLIPPTVDCAFGKAVALSGNTAVISASWEDVSGRVRQGAAYVYERSGTTWPQQARLGAADGAAFDTFGSSVSVSGDTAVVGAEGDDDGASSAGSAYVFVRNGTTWTQQAKLTASTPSASARLGAATSLSGGTVLLGAPGATGGGAAYAFLRTGTTWTQQARLSAAETVGGDEFGDSVALSGDTALVGAPRHDVGSLAVRGRAYLFLRNGGAWAPAMPLPAVGGSSGDELGRAVALHGDVAVAGAPFGGAFGYAAVFSGLCHFVIDPVSLWTSASAASRVVTIRAGQPVCGWDTTSQASWLTVDAPSTRTGDGAVTLKIAANSGPARTGTARVAGQSVMVSQEGGCSYTITPSSTTVSAAGGPVAIHIVASDAACRWVASDRPTWVHYAGGTDGQGDLPIVVLPNPGPARTGTVTISGRTFTVNQVGGCSYGVTPTSLSVGAQGGVASLALAASDPGCPWTATSPASWAAIAGPSGGTGSTTIGVDVDPNTGAPRQATLSVAGQSIAISQEGRTTPGGHATVYLAEGATSAFFDTQVALLNPGDTTADVTLRYLRASGGPVTHALTLPARHRTTIWPKQQLGTAEFSTVVESSAPLIVDRTVSWDSRGYGAHAETAVPAPALTWYLAEGATHSGLDLFYLVQNPNESPATLDVRYLRPSPLPVVTKTYTVPAASRFNIWVNLEDAALSATDVSAVLQVTNGQPVIVERAMYHSVPGMTFSAGHESAGVTALARTWFLAEGNTGPYFDLFVLLANPSPTPADVRVTYLLPDGTSYTRSLTVAAESRANLWVDYETPDGTTGFPLADTAVSTTVSVTNDVPILVERALWWPYDVSRWYEAHNSPGATATGTAWALAEGEAGGARGVETYILVANTSAFVGTATVTLLFEDGTSAVKAFTLPPNSRTNVSVGAEFPAAAGRRFGAVIESTGAMPAQIVVERAMYWNAGGVPWAAGTNAMGTRLR